MEIKKQSSNDFGNLTTIKSPKTGKIMFLAKEVAEQWGHTNMKQAVSRLLVESEYLLADKKNYPEIFTELIRSGLSLKAQRIILISEQGLLKLAINSRSVAAKTLVSNIVNNIISARVEEGLTIDEFIGLLSGAYTFIRESKKTYVMKDMASGLFKIGRSANPKLREKTLQSEKPTITMLLTNESDVESVLHKRYYKKRIRGEWFDLSNDDVLDLINEGFQVC